MIADVRRILAATAALSAFAGCSSSGSSDAAHSPSPQASASYYDTTDVEPADCVRKSEDYRYYDVASRRPLPRIERFAPYSFPKTYIHFYMHAVNGKNVGIELPDGARSPKGPTYQAVPMTPVIVGALSYGKRDRATVAILPSGRLSDDYVWYLKYLAKRANAAEQTADAVLASSTASPIPVNTADEEREKEFTAQGMPAVNALTRGSAPDDRFFKDFTIGSTKYNDADPHVRLFTCDYLEFRPYDAIFTLVRKRRLSDEAYKQLQAQLQQQRAPDNLIDDAGYVAFEKSIYVAHGIWPQLWPPDIAKSFDDDTVRQRAFPFQFEEIAKVELPTPDATTKP